jgi:hypothetical protein
MTGPSDSGGSGHAPGTLDRTVLRQRHEIREMASGFRQARR